MYPQHPKGKSGQPINAFLLSKIRSVLFDTFESMIKLVALVLKTLQNIAVKDISAVIQPIVAPIISDSRNITKKSLTALKNALDSKCPEPIVYFSA